MTTELRPEVYKRIVLAKFLHEAGAAACAVKHDQMAFSKGLLLLHDSVEAALGAVADHIHAKLKGNTYLLEYYDLIDNEASRQGRRVAQPTRFQAIGAASKARTTPLSKISFRQREGTP